MHLVEFIWLELVYCLNVVFHCLMRLYALKRLEYDFIVCLAMFICYGRGLVIFRDFMWFWPNIWPE